MNGHEYLLTYWFCTEYVVYHIPLNCNFLISVTTMNKTYNNDFNWKQYIIVSMYSELPYHSCQTNNCLQFREMDVHQSLNRVARVTAHAVIASSPCLDSSLHSTMLAFRKLNFQDSCDGNQWTWWSIRWSFRWLEHLFHHNSVESELQLLRS